MINGVSPKSFCETIGHNSYRVQSSQTDHTHLCNTAYCKCQCQVHRVFRVQESKFSRVHKFKHSFIITVSDENSFSPSFTHISWQVHISMVLYQQLYQVLSAEVSSIEQWMTTILQMINSVDMTTTTTVIITTLLTSSQMSGSTPCSRK